MQVIRMILLLAFVLALTACQVRVNPWLVCAGGSSSGVACAGGANVNVTARRPGTEGFYSDESIASLIQNGTFDAAKLSWDFSGSTTPITTTSGNLVVVATLTNSTQLSTSFAWTRVGQSIVASNPTAVNSWLAGIKSPIDTIDVTFGTITTDNYAGTNVMTGEVKYDSVVQNGAASAWYNDCSGYCVIR